MTLRGQPFPPFQISQSGTDCKVEPQPTVRNNQDPCPPWIKNKRERPSWPWMLLVSSVLLWCTFFFDTDIVFSGYFHLFRYVFVQHWKHSFACIHICVCLYLLYQEATFLYAIYMCVTYICHMYVSQYDFTFSFPFFTYVCLHECEWIWGVDRVDMTCMYTGMVA